MDRPMGEARRTAGWFALLTVRGLILWLLVPVGFVLWLLFGWIASVGLGVVLGWMDLNLIAALQRVLLRPMSGEASAPRIEFVPLRLLPTVKHRLHLAYDPV